MLFSFAQARAKSEPCRPARRAARSKRRMFDAAGQRARIEQEIAVAIVNSRPRAGRRGEPAQHRPDPFGIDRELQRGRRIVGEPIAFARRELQQLFGIDGDRIGVDRGGGRDRRRDDFALRLQALHARVDQAFAELIEIEKAEQQGDEPAEIEDDDAARQRRRETRTDAAQRIRAGARTNCAASASRAARPPGSARNRCPVAPRASPLALSPGEARHPRRNATP